MSAARFDRVDRKVRALAKSLGITEQEARPLVLRAEHLDSNKARRP